MALGDVSVAGSPMVLSFSARSRGVTDRVIATCNGCEAGVAAERICKSSGVTAA